jgi:phosphomannomutase
MQKLVKDNYDIFIATDPDCDRMGVVVNHKGVPIPLTGNQIACIAAEYILRALKEQARMPKKPACIKTIVTTELFRKIVLHHEAQCFDVLTGFKYIAEKIRQWENEANGDNYVFGGEESYGYLYGTYTRDKDAVTATCVISEIASQAKKESKTLLDYLDELYIKWGYYLETLIALQFEETKVGKERMYNITQSLRASPPTHIAGLSVLTFSDLVNRTSIDLTTSITSQVNLPASDVLIFDLEDATRVVIRPSGTEPKMKVYLMLWEKTASKSDLDKAQKRASERAAIIGEDIRKIILG